MCGPTTFDSFNLLCIVLLTDVTCSFVCWHLTSYRPVQIGKSLMTCYTCCLDMRIVLKSSSSYLLIDQWMLTKCNSFRKPGEGLVSPSEHFWTTYIIHSIRWLRYILRYLASETWLANSCECDLQEILSFMNQLMMVSFAMDCFFIYCYCRLQSEENSAISLLAVSMSITNNHLKKSSFSEYLSSFSLRFLGIYGKWSDCLRRSVTVYKVNDPVNSWLWGVVAHW